MRILLLCSTDLNGCINLNTLLPTLAEHHTISIMLSSWELAAERGNPFADKKIWYEKDVPCTLLFPQLDNMQVNDARLLTFSGLSRRWHVPMQSIPPHEAQACMHAHAVSFAPDVIFCCRFDHVIHNHTASLARFGAFNTHSGRLPECAGPDATFWAMYNGWSHSACTLHVISDEIDGGDIVAEAHFALDHSRSLLWNRTQAYAHGMPQFTRLVARLDQGLPLERRRQDKAQRHYYSFPSAETFGAFHQAGGRLIDPSGYMSLLQCFAPAGMKLAWTDYSRPIASPSKYA